MRVVGSSIRKMKGTITITGTNWSTTKAELIPYKTIDGKWRLTGNIGGTLSSPASNIQLTLSGISFSSDYNSAEQAFTFWAQDSGVADRLPKFGRISNAAGGVIQMAVDSSTADVYNCFIDLSLDAKPSWAELG